MGCLTGAATTGAIGQQQGAQHGRQQNRSKLSRSKPNVPKTAARIAPVLPPPFPDPSVVLLFDPGVVTTGPPGVPLFGGTFVTGAVAGELFPDTADVAGPADPPGRVVPVPPVTPVAGGPPDPGLAVVPVPGAMVGPVFKVVGPTLPPLPVDPPGAVVAGGTVVVETLQ